MSIRTRTSGIMVDINVEPAAAPAATATWDPTHTGAALTLSNGNLTASLNIGGVDNSTRGTLSAISGKKYWEHTADDLGDGNYIFGICNELLAATNVVGVTTNGLGSDKDGNILFNSGVITTIQTFAAGNTVCFALDIDNAKIWFRTNGGNWNNSPTANPATNTEGIAMSIVGTIYPASSGGTILTAAFTANFGATAYAQSPPAGFSNW